MKITLFDFSYEKLTKYRLELFGFAALWIFFSHTCYIGDFHYGIFQEFVEVGFYRTTLSADNKILNGGEVNQLLAFTCIIW